MSLTKIAFLAVLLWQAIIYLSSPYRADMHLFGSVLAILAIYFLDSAYKKLDVEKKIYLGVFATLSFVHILGLLHILYLGDAQREWKYIAKLQPKYEAPFKEPVGVSVVVQFEKDVSQVFFPHPPSIYLESSEPRAPFFSFTSVDDVPMRPKTMFGLQGNSSHPEAGPEALKFRINETTFVYDLYDRNYKDFLKLKGCMRSEFLEELEQAYKEPVAIPNMRFSWAWTNKFTGEMYYVTQGGLRKGGFSSPPDQYPEITIDEKEKTLKLLANAGRQYLQKKMSQIGYAACGTKDITPEDKKSGFWKIGGDNQKKCYCMVKK